MSATSTPIPTPDPNSRLWSIYIDSQSFNVTGLDGTPTTLSFGEINSQIYAVGAEAACAGFALGFVSMLFIVLLLITPAAKIRKPIFLLNLVCLFLVAFRELMIMIVSCASYQGVGQQFLLGFAQYPNSTWSANIMNIVSAIGIYALVMTSLVLQVRVVFAAEPRTRKIFTIIGAIAVIVETAFTTTWVAFYIRFYYNYIDWLPLWLLQTFKIFFCAFVGVASLIFLYKLGFTIYRRHKMGMNINQFGPLQIIFIMFCQCLIVPRN